MLDVCEVCDDLVDIDHRFMPGFDKTRPVLCGGTKCLKPADQRYLCQRCDKRCGELKEHDFGTVGFMQKTCQKCIDREKRRVELEEVKGHPA